MTVFSERIGGWDDWGGVFRSVPAFAPLVESILRREGLPPARIENLAPGTNAVFRAGDYAVKVYAPAESGMDRTDGPQTELFAVRRAGTLGVSAPKLIAGGFVEDRYRFAYMIMEYIDGVAFTEAVKTMSGAEKTEFGRKLRAITDRMNTPCERFNTADPLDGGDRDRRWEPYPGRFRAERLSRVQSRDYGEKVFVHGDLCGDNILLTPGGGLCLIDFADAALAPVEYEHALVAVELFGLDPALLRGYFGDYSVAGLTEVCFGGLLIHEFGGGVVASRVGRPDTFQTLGDLRERLRERIERGCDAW
ncbi:MAG: aminoglycoside phosphotransferase family protein [Oscillospiraceae bacterium]|nr:aminoglycoside phosphotransferase family protein [Oscillospiraceae bacterium]